MFTILNKESFKNDCAMMVSGSWNDETIMNASKCKSDECTTVRGQFLMYSSHSKFRLNRRYSRQFGRYKNSIGSRRLHFPRNVMWLGIGLTNILFLISHLFEVVSVRAIFTCSNGTSMGYMTLVMMFASLERHICVNYSTWYKARLAVRFIILLQVVTITSSHYNKPT